MNIEKNKIDELKNPNLCKVRTITSFITLWKNVSTWEKEILKISLFNSNLSKEFHKKWYEVQTLRLVTNPFWEYLNTSSLELASIWLEKIKKVLKSPLMPNIRIRFSIWEAKNHKELDLLPKLIKKYSDICNSCCNIWVDEFWVPDNFLTKKCAEIVKKIWESTKNWEWNFNFTVNYNCKSFIPYFPTSYHRWEKWNCFVIWFENPNLLVKSLEILKPYLKNLSHNEKLKKYFEVMSFSLQYHNDILNKISSDFAEKNWVNFLWTDTSSAPSINAKSIVDIYKLLWVEYFWATWTLEISAFLTKLFKSVKWINQIWYSGLMLAVTEDLWLTEDSIKWNFDIRTLLSNSAVCGIWLDTVPIPWNTSVEKISSLMRDTWTLAFRLNKPLTVRLFPVPWLKAWDLTKFETSDLCNCKVFDVF